jgi:hypothetical protein
MAKNRSSLVKAFLALSMAILVIGYIVVKSGAIEKNVETKMIDGKTTETSSYRFNAAKIPVYLKSFVAPITGSKALDSK